MTGELTSCAAFAIVLDMNYRDFLVLADKPTGKNSNGYGPLWFGDAQSMLENIADFSVMDDFMSDQGIENFVEEYPTKFPTYSLLAMLDLDLVMERDPHHHHDSYDEYFLVVDTAHPEHRVLVWTGESAFEELCSSFEAFYASLADTNDD
jgi:hypothetical protein